MAEFGQPPRVTGRPDADLAAVVDWLWDFYRNAILEQGLVQDSQLPEELEAQFPILFGLGVLEGTAPDLMPYFADDGSGVAEWALTGLTAFSRTVLDDANAAAWQSTLGISGVITDAELLAIAGLVSAADRLPYFTGAGTASLATFTALARTFLAFTTESQYRTQLGIDTSSAGAYTPALTNVANLDASTAYECQYIRVGNNVHVSGRVDLDPTAAGAVQLGIALPVASNIGATEDCAGVAFASGIAGQGAAITGDAANNRAELQFIAVDTTNQPMYFSFTYQVL
jgi:hypothetical protein